MYFSTLDELARGLEELSPREIAERVYKDPLTGDGNHNKLIHDLKNLEGRKSVGIVSADNLLLKVANEAFGHDVGNAIIRVKHRVLRVSFEWVDGVVGGEVYRDVGDESFVILECSEDALKEVVRRIYGVYILYNLSCGSHILGDPERMKVEITERWPLGDFDRAKEEISPIIKEIGKKYKIPPILPLWVTLAYSYYPGRGNPLDALDEVRGKVSEEKRRFYERYPELNPRGRMDDIIEILREMK